MNHSFRSNSVVRTTFIALTALLAGACTLEVPVESDASTRNELYPDSNLLFMPSGDSNQTNLRLCWQHNSQNYPTERGWVEDTITQTWDANSWVNFEWRYAWAPGGCGGPGAIPLRNKDEWPNGDRNGITFNFIDPALYEGSRGCSGAESCIRGVAVHEVGHALGYDHENAHIALSCSNGSTYPADLGTYTVDGDFRLGPVDGDSVMGGCPTGSWQLSAGDIDGVQAVYGAGGRHIEHDTLVFVRQDDAKFWQVVDNATVPSDEAHVIRSSLRILRASAGVVTYGEKVRFKRGAAYMCGRTGTSALPAGIVWQTTYVSAKCDWEVRRSAANVGGTNVDVNDPFKLYLKITATQPGETTFEHTSTRLRMIQDI